MPCFLFSVIHKASWRQLQVESCALRERAAAMGSWGNRVSHLRQYITFTTYLYSNRSFTWDAKWVSDTDDIVLLRARHGPGLDIKFENVTLQIEPPVDKGSWGCPSSLGICRAARHARTPVDRYSTSQSSLGRDTLRTSCGQEEDSHLITESRGLSALLFCFIVVFNILLIYH